MSNRKQIRVLYLCQGAGLAGAESYGLNLISKISCSKNIKCFAASFYEGPFLEHLENDKVETLALYGKNNLKSIIAVINYARSAGIDIIHCIDLKSTIVGGFASLFLNKVKTVSTIHGLPEPYNRICKQLIYCTSLAIYFSLLRFLFNAKICVSKDLNYRLQKLIGSTNNQVIHNGVALKVLANNFDNHFNKSMVNIGTVGRLEKVKGHDYLISAAQMILSERDDINFYIIGTGPLEESLKKRVSTLGLTNKIHFLGFRADAKKLIDGLDIFVLPSLHEGIPYVLLEAMAAHKPVVCTNVGGVPEVVTHQHDGILVPPKDPDGLCQAIKKLLFNRDYMEFLSNNARCKVEQCFSSDLMAEKTYSLYVKLLNS